MVGGSSDVAVVTLEVVENSEISFEGDFHSNCIKKLTSLTIAIHFG